MAQTKPGRDALAVEQLRAQDFEVMQPTYLKRRLVRGSVLYDRRPLFGGYLFIGCYLDNSRWNAINSTRGVTRLMMDGDSPARLRADVVEVIQKHCDADDEDMGEVDAHELLNKLVRVTGGPFELFNGTCITVERSVGNVMLSIFGRLTQVTVPLKWLDRVEA